MILRLYSMRCIFFMCFDFFLNDTATTEIYSLSLHDALPICRAVSLPVRRRHRPSCDCRERSLREACRRMRETSARRSEEHTSELQSRQYLVCRLLLEKKN